MKKFYPTEHVPSCIHSTFSLFFIFLLISVFSQVAANAQVNAYARVTTVNAAKTTLTLQNTNQTFGNFVVGNQVIVLQMQDNVIGTNTNNNSSFGNLGTIANVGVFEVATVLSFTSTQMVLRNPLKNTYNTGANSRVQVVSFNNMGTPNYSPEEDISALPWNGSIGGVVAFQVSGTLTLRRDIRADGAGFRGGNASNNNNLACTNQQTVFITNNTANGAKGEGIYCATNANYARGMGHLLTGGGGGNGYNGGGGGGSNYTAGGLAGRGRNCTAQTGGLGGVSLSTSMTTGNRLIMGGGGGGGQGDNGNQTAGGNGGGIVIVKAQRLATTFLRFPFITANGDNAETTEGGDGAGGGGAAGAIFLQVVNYDPSFIDYMFIQAHGGDGGSVDHPQTHGGGGGGGQGAILFSGFAPTGNISYTTASGQGGANSNAGGATEAGDGAGGPNQGIVPSVGSPLPVRLLNFNAAKSDKKTRVAWTSTDELNTIFEIQHSTDGIEYTTIGTINGTGVDNAITNYTFTHNMPAPGNNFYRLLMTEFPNFKTYSTIASVSFNDLPETPLAWPNPAKDQFNVRLTDVSNNTNYEITISDLAGKIVYTSSLKPVNNIITVRTGTLQHGMYVVCIATATRKHFVKLMVQ